MALIPVTADECLARLDDYDMVIDARSESEYALDRLPGAVNWPSLNDAERALVGTEYKQISPFVARKRGAALVARNIAMHIERHIDDKSRDWQPLVYCWRGGQRSGSLALVLSKIGFRVQVLEGGYQAYRRAVMTALEVQPLNLHFRVLCGKTGAGKSRLLAALQTKGAQVLDLEGLANHRGSVLGLVPGSPQPTQKQFDSRLWDALRRFDPSRPVWVESERLELSVDARVALLMEDYAFFVDDVPTFCGRLDALRALRGNEVINQWQEAARSGRIESVVRDLLVTHYDPVYLQSMQRNFVGFADAPKLEPANGDASTMAGVAMDLLQD
jgi:tRNA 2-selenouridine synthase